MNASDDKRFLYDVLIDEKDVCDRNRELGEMLGAARKNKRIVLLAPRRYGKTSIVKNVIGKAASGFRPKRLVLAVDFMSVNSLRSIALRLNHGIGQGLARRFSPANLLEQASRLVKRFSVGMELNPITGAPTVQINMNPARDEENILLLSDTIVSISNHQPLMLIFDEFQDIGLVPEAEGLLRSMLQNVSQASVFLLGSKRHLMERMLGDANAPLFGYGDEMTLGPIALEAWEPYFDERLAPRGAAISLSALKYLVDRMCDVPNAICELGAWLQDYHSGQRIDEAAVESALDNMVERKQGYAYRLSGLTAIQRRLLYNVSIIGFVAEPAGKEFVQMTGLAKSTVASGLNQLLDRGIVEQELNRGWRLSDPILAHYMRRQRPI